MIPSQNIYGYDAWVVISIVLFDISKNDPFLVPYIVHLAKMPQQCKFKRKNANITRQFANLTGKR